jgi:hypothetical protein
MDKIECKARHDESGGCPHCGGYGFLVQLCKAECCGVEYWSRPGNFTVHAGKRYRTFDGTYFIVGEDLQSRCIGCAALEKHGKAR